MSKELIELLPTGGCEAGTTYAQDLFALDGDAGWAFSESSQSSKLLRSKSMRGTAVDEGFNPGALAAEPPN